MWHERNWKMRVEDILVCIGKIKTYTQSMTFEQFSADDKTVDAVIRNFEIIGEAASHIPLEIQDQYPPCMVRDAWNAKHHRPCLLVSAYQSFGTLLNMIYQP